MKDDLISRQAALTTYQDRVCYGIACIDCPFRFRVSQTATDCKLERFIHKLPSAQPERTGRWMVMETAYEDTVAKCPECGFETLVNEPGNGFHFLSDLHYCPSCGLPMEVEHDG